MLEMAEPGLLTSSVNLIKIGARFFGLGRHLTFQMAEVAVPRQMFQEISCSWPRCGLREMSGEAQPPTKHRR